MADTIRETIIKSIVSTLENYSSFETITDHSVDRGHELISIDDVTLPHIEILPRPEEVEDLNGSSLMTMPVDVFCTVKIGEHNPSELGEAVLGELIAAMLSSLPSGADGLQYTGGGVDEYLDKLGQGFLTVGVSINVTYFTDAGDPYTMTT